MMMMTTMTMRRNIFDEQIHVGQYSPFLSGLLVYSLIELFGGQFVDKASKML